MSEQLLPALVGEPGISPSYDYHGRSPEKQKIMVAVMGVVGVGKTSFIDTFSGNERVRGNSLEPSNPKIDTQEVSFDGREIIFVDVPGFDNPIKPDILILKDFLKYIHLKAIKGIGLSGILYLHRITDVRMSGSVTKNMKLLRGICGDAFLRRLTLVTTMWDIIQNTEDGDRREQELRDVFWEDLIKHGASPKQYNGTIEAARRVMGTYLYDPFLPSVTASIQQQAGRPLGQTDMGRVELESIRKAEYQHTLRCEALQRQQTELQSSGLKPSELQEEQAIINEELQEVEKKIADLRALLARYSVQNADFDPERRSEQTSEMADQEEAIEAARQAAGLTTYNRRDWLERLDKLGAMLESRYERTDNIADLEEASSIFRDAWHRQIAIPFYGIKAAARYFKLLVVQSNIQMAIQLGENIIDFLPVVYHQLGSRSDRQVVESIFARVATDLCASLLEFDQPVDALQYLEKGRATLIDQLADTRNELPSVAQQHPDTAHQYPDTAYQYSDAAHHYPDTAHQYSDTAHQYPDAVHQYPDTAHQYPDTAYQHPDTTHQHPDTAHQHPDTAHQYSDATHRHPYTAHQYPDTAHQYPDTPRQYEQIREEANTSLHTIEYGMQETLVIDRRPEAMSDLDACIQWIRGIAGSEPFLHSKTTAEMQKCAAGGAIVVINIAQFRSDAIIVSPTAIKGLNLPQLQASDAQNWLSKKWTGDESERAQENEEYPNYLSWLWEVGVKDILQEVETIHNRADCLPRVWWIRTGLASSMPFHAAGTYFVGSTDNTNSRAISSYAPSIRALQSARHREIAPESGARF